MIDETEIFFTHSDSWELKDNLKNLSSYSVDIVPAILDKSDTWLEDKRLVDTIKVEEVNESPQDLLDQNLHQEESIKDEKNNAPILFKNIFKCEVCLEIFPSNAYFIKHRCRPKWGIKKKALSKSKTIKNEAHRLSHINKNVEHKREELVFENLFKCNYCPKDFKNRTSLIEHERVHTGEKPYGCDLCEKFFRTSAALIGHRKAHEDPKPHVCDICDKRFSAKTSLTSHKQRLHEGTGKWFFCKTCDKKFTRKTILDKHSKTHKPIICEICGITFQKPQDLVSHLEIHLDEKT